MLEHAAANNPTLTLDDLRRDVRLGMGPCQGGFCAFRAAGILHENRYRHGPSVETNREPNEPAVTGAEPVAESWEVAYLQSPAHAQAVDPPPVATLPPDLSAPGLLLRDFLQERWKGVTPILWGQQLVQQRLDELLYLSLLNVDHLPEGTGNEAQDGDSSMGEPARPTRRRSRRESPLSAFYRYNPMPDGEDG
jgi:glycerol-3-phosphate dehydrogenase